MLTIESLFDHWPGLVAFYRRRTRDAMLAEDLAAQVMLKALAAERSGHGSHSHLRGWLFRIARNLLIDHHRTRAARTPCWSLEESWNVADSSGDPAQHVERLDAKATVAGLLPQLSEPQRQVLCLYELEGYTLAETAQHLNKAVGAVKSLRHRGLETLRQAQGRQLHQSINRTAPPG